jgi:hypothetical protein
MSDGLSRELPGRRRAGRPFFSCPSCGLYFTRYATPTGSDRSSIRPSIDPVEMNGPHATRTERHSRAVKSDSQPSSQHANSCLVSDADRRGICLPCRFAAAIACLLAPLLSVRHCVREGLTPNRAAPMACGSPIRAHASAPSLGTRRMPASKSASFSMSSSQTRQPPGPMASPGACSRRRWASSWVNELARRRSEWTGLKTMKRLVPTRTVPAEKHLLLVTVKWRTELDFAPSATRSVIGTTWMPYSEAIFRGSSRS